ncbi:MAG: hypothetical protein K2X99_09245 [Gemmatimonadaceae bacterium]|nr:hypothetical protein [Gemmatimonadaceae bacterium]
MTPNHRFAARVFRWAGILGIVALAPQYLLELGVGLPLPTPLTRPEHFYGFVGVALAWQLAFLVIATDVARFRRLMPIAVVEKLSFGLPCVLLYALQRVGPDVLIAGLFDLGLGLLFFLAWRRTSAN